MCPSPGILLLRLEEDRRLVLGVSVLRDGPAKMCLWLLKVQHYLKTICLSYACYFDVNIW